MELATKADAGAAGPEQPPPRTDGLGEEIRRALDTIGDPCSVAQGVPMGLAEMGVVGSVDVDESGHARIGLRLTSPACMMVGYFNVEAERLLLAIPGISAVTITADTGLDWRPEMMSESAIRRRREALRARGMPAAALPRLSHGRQ